VSFAAVMARAPTALTATALQTRVFYVDDGLQPAVRNAKQDAQTLRSKKLQRASGALQR